MGQSVRHWLLKTEPREYSFADLEREGVTSWDGVKNPQALRSIAAMTAGDRVVIYHSGGQRAAVGLAEVSREPRPDPEGHSPNLLAVDVRVGRRLRRPIELGALRAEPVFAGSPLLRQARLSVVPLAPEQWERILTLGGVTG